MESVGVVMMKKTNLLIKNDHRQSTRIADSYPFFISNRIRIFKWEEEFQELSCGKVVNLRQVIFQNL